MTDHLGTPSGVQCRIDASGNWIVDIVKFSFPLCRDVCLSGIFWFKNNFHIKGFRSRCTKAKDLIMQVARLAESFRVFVREILGCQASLI